MSVLIQSASHPHNFFDHGRHASEKALVLSTASTITLPKEQIPLGLGIPLNTPHAISCSIPTWSDNFAFMAKDERVTAAMKTGYPRSFIHPSVQKVLITNATQKVSIADTILALGPVRAASRRRRGTLPFVSFAEGSRAVPRLRCKAILQRRVAGQRASCSFIIYKRKRVGDRG